MTLLQSDGSLVCISCLDICRLVLESGLHYCLLCWLDSLAGWGVDFISLLSLLSVGAILGCCFLTLLYRTVNLIVYIVSSLSFTAIPVMNILSAYYTRDGLSRSMFSPPSLTAISHRRSTEESLSSSPDPTGESL